MLLTVILAMNGAFAKSLPTKSVAVSKHKTVELLDNAAAKSKLPVTLLRAIASVESGNDPSKVNRKTHDYGLMQINHLTATRHGKLPNQMLDAEQNIDMAVNLLKQYKRQFGHEPNWECRYNLGTSKHVSTWNSCKKYFQKLVRAGYSK